MRSQKISFSGLAQPFEQTYSYDDLNRLQSAEEKVQGTTTWKQTFIIDRYGNRRFDAANTTTLGSCGQTICNPNISTANNRLVGYGFDANGNVTQDAAGQRFGYDAENHQKEFFLASNPGSVADASYSYDGEGKRVKNLFLMVICFVFSTLLMSCKDIVSNAEPSKVIQAVNAVSPTPSSTPSAADIKRTCSQLSRLERLPHSPNDVIDDPIYNTLRDNREAAIPCLVEKLTDTTLMKDPGPGPTISDFRVGDAAMFTLLLITKEKWQPETMLSPDYAKLWETEGVYAYFAYVEKPENRKKMQDWWRKWLKEKPEKRLE